MTNLEELILVAEDCPVDKSEEPPIGKKKTIARYDYEILIANPYKYTEIELFKEVHHVQRKRLHLKIDTYNIKRSMLVQHYGWGVHRDNQGRLALIPMESAEYKNLQETITTKNSYRINKA